MVDDADLQGLDPYDLMQAEAARLDRFFAGLDDAAWSQPSRCAAGRCVTCWRICSRPSSTTLRVSTGPSRDFLASVGAKGATDLDVARTSWASVSSTTSSTAELLDEWRARERGTPSRVFATATAATSTRAWAPIRHAGRPSTSRSSWRRMPTTSVFRSRRRRSGRRNAWQAQFGRFALKELNKDLEIKAGNGATQVRGDGIDVELPDAVFVQAVAARLGDDGPLDAEQRALLSATP